MSLARTDETTPAPPAAPAVARPYVHYPDSDGEPMSDNTEQWEWMVTLKGNLDACLPDFVASDLLWYPVEGDNKTRMAPDVMVAFGRPKGYRGSYKQWEEDGVAPQVVFEIWSPGNRFADVVRKVTFYQRFGVEEFYLYDPARRSLEGWLRRPDGLHPIEGIDGYTSPRLGTRFALGPDGLEVYRPDGSRFLTFSELEAARQSAEAARQSAEAARQSAEAARQSAEARALEAEAQAAALAAELAALRAKLGGL
ncbi:Uma2 family endonuclease [Myxococcota bacterium]|nr:Uma2 family endonuclease [Myxococcota bacterium]